MGVLRIPHPAGGVDGGAAAGVRGLRARAGAQWQAAGSGRVCTAAGFW